MQETPIDQEFRAYIGRLGFWDSIVLRSTTALSNDIRSYFGNGYLQGEGIEIGAQQNPIKIKTDKARIKYVDRIHPEEVARIHGMPVESLVKPDILAEADDLREFTDSSLDFVISNHLLEHMDDPIGAIVEWLRVLKEKGILFISVPNFRANSYDFLRNVADSTQLVSAHEHSAPPHRTRRKIERLKEYIVKVDRIAEDDRGFEERLRLYIKIDYRIHFYVYDNRLLAEILEYIHHDRGKKIRVRDSFSFRYGYENIIVIEKDSCYQGCLSLGNLPRFFRNCLILWYLSVAR